MKKLAISFLIILSVVLISNAQKVTFDLKASIGRGLGIYQANCITCHMEGGDGLEGVYPPLAKSDYLMADKKRSIAQILNGLTGPIKVKGVDYDAEMTAIDLNDQDVSDVVNYIRNTWGNKGDGVTPDDVKVLRKKP
jgi:mono/diheme cytochrome c family protein